jgi:EAL domain-containing protein (putative c-di-GMP-specific phosphodiesterase class I)
VAELSRLTGHPLTLSVNVSGLEFGDEALPQRIQARLDAAGFPAERLELELTESVLVDNVDLMIRALGELRAIGVRIAIDDFGTGYSSLSYVHAFPADTLKIDRSFVVDLMERGQTRAVVSAILVLAEGLDLDVVAEGVETPAQLELLRDLGCGLAQGFGLAKPMPIEELCERVWSEQAKPGELAVGH